MSSMNETCRAELIDGYLDDHLSPQDESAVERHLETCINCQRTIASSAGSNDDWQQITTALRPDEFDTDTEASPRFWPLSLLGPTDDPRMLGRIGPFEVSACVGIGGMGVVFKARDPALDRYVAVKVLSPQLAASETARIRFAREAKAAAAVVHNNVIAVHQVSDYNQLPYLVMPYLPGPSLEHRLRRHGPMSVLAALRVAKQVAAGLAAAHDQNLIHRDIKPANILLSGETERAVLTDFGLARAVDDASLTRSGTLAGTPQFMAPEQAQGENVDVRSDIFSLGALLFAMLAGRPAVQNLSGAETVRQVGSHPPPQLSDVMENVPAWLQDLMNSLHAFDPSRRIASAAEVEHTIARLMTKAGERPLKRRHPVDGAALNAKGRRLRMAVFGAVSLVAIAVVWQALPLFDGSPKPPSSVTQSHSPSTSTPATAIIDRPTLPETGTTTTAEATEPSPPPIRQITPEEISTLLADPEANTFNNELKSIDHDLEALENR